MCHAGRSLHQWIDYVALKNIRHALAAGYFMGKDGGGTLIRRASHFARPHGNAVAHATRHKLEPQVSIVGVKYALGHKRTFAMQLRMSAMGHDRSRVHPNLKGQEDDADNRRDEQKISSRSV
jgi:hypothetical protein